MPEKRKIKAKEILADIKAGMTDNELVVKYHVSQSALKSIFQKLIDAGSLTQSQLEERIPPDRIKTYGEKPRNLHRNYVFVKLPIYELENLLHEGQVVDITEGGIQIIGIEAKVGEKKGFLIQADYFADVFPFSFEAECKWATRERDGRWRAGFKILSMSEKGLEELRKLIRMLSLG